MLTGWRIGTAGAGATAALLAGGTSARAQDTTVSTGTASGSLVTVDGPKSPAIEVGSTTAAVAPTQDAAAESNAAPIRTDDSPSSEVSTSTDSTTPSKSTEPTTVSEGVTEVKEATSTSKTTTPSDTTSTTNAKTSIESGTIAVDVGGDRTVDIAVGSGSSRVNATRRGKRSTTHATARIGRVSDRKSVTIGDRLTVDSVESEARTGIDSKGRPHQRLSFTVRGVRLHSRYTNVTLINVKRATPGKNGSTRITLSIRTRSGTYAQGQIQLRRGQNLLTRAAFQGSDLLGSFDAMRPALARLRTGDGPLPGLKLIFGVRTVVRTNKRVHISVTPLSVELHASAEGDAGSSGPPRTTVVGLGSTEAVSRRVAAQVSKHPPAAPRHAVARPRVSLRQVAAHVAPVAVAPLRVREASLRLSPRGTLLFEVHCDKAFNGVLQLQDRSHQRLGRVAIDCAAGTKHRVHVKLSHSAAQRLRADEHPQLRAFVISTGAPVFGLDNTLLLTLHRT
jgi:hypothetical protein